MWCMYIREGLHEDYLEFENFHECTSLAYRMKKAYPWYKIKVRRMPVCG